MSKIASKHLFLLILVISLFIAGVAPVSATIITFSNVYGPHSVTVAGVTISPTISLSTTELATPFDPSLGTLQNIDIRFSGFIAFSVIPGPNIIGGFVPTPVPYSIVPTLSLDIDGSNGFYDFGSPATFTKSFVSPGSGQAIISSDSYSFTFNYFDLLGQFVGPTNVGGPVTPPFLLHGDLNDFIASNTLLNELLFTYELSFFESGRVLTIPTTITATNFLTVTTTYTYTPVSIPEPGTLALLGIGLAGMGVVRRRKKA